MRATRDGFGEAILELAKSDERIIGLTADLTESTRMGEFSRQLPSRFWNVGVSEQNMVGVATGMSIEGFIPFATTYGVFLGRAWDQIRISVCITKANVKLVGTHAGVTVGADGGSAQALEDIAMLRALPNLTIVCPCDAVEAKKATLAIAQMVGPVYLRLSREPSAQVTTLRTPFVLGRAEILNSGKDVSIFACGTMVASALRAAKDLEKEKISVRIINVHTIKPIDKQTILASAKETGAVVVAEEHQMEGGLGSAVAETLALGLPTPMEQVAVAHSFGESGTAEGLLIKYKLTPNDIVRAVKRVLRRKKQKTNATSSKE
ncbi:MAG TPA: transketolase C-terminal domain-containing protein [Patescibacteria group bacterium]|nr:transketolase C-terminal domain-containing protein [Patescibacteria group bacterium]